MDFMSHPTIAHAHQLCLETFHRQEALKIQKERSEIPATMKYKQPNILFIMADDHAAKAISAYGAGINHTPNIDRLAKEGMLFNHCYVTNSICTPSRATILTGVHNHLNGVMTLDDQINKFQPNVAKFLKHAGYQTAMIGKWHLGEGFAHEPMGFDYWSVLPGQGVFNFSYERDTCMGVPC